MSNITKKELERYRDFLVNELSAFIEEIKTIAENRDEKLKEIL